MDNSVVPQTKLSQFSSIGSVYVTQPGRSEITVPYKLLISPPIESNCQPNNRRHPLPFNWQELIFTVYYPHQWSRPFGASSLSVFFGCTTPPQHCIGALRFGRVGVERVSYPIDTNVCLSRTDRGDPTTLRNSAKQQYQRRNHPSSLRRC